MPPYEVSILAKALAKTETLQVMKRVCQTIWKGEGVIKKVENLGVKDTPYIMSTLSGERCGQARYIIMDVDMTIPNAKLVLSEVRKDLDVIRSNAVRLDHEFIRPCISGKECTFGENMIDETKRRNWKRSKLKKTYLRVQNREK